MARIPEKKKKTWLGAVIAIAAVMLGVAAFFVVDYMIYENRKDSYYYYKDHPEVYQGIADELLKRIADEGASDIYVLNSDFALKYGAGKRVIVYMSGDADAKPTAYDSYEDYFSKDITKLIKKLFMYTIAQRIIIVKEAPDTYRIDFYEESNSMGMTMMLSYLSKPASDEQGIKDYYGASGDKVQYIFSEHWYYIQDMV